MKKYGEDAATVYHQLFYSSFIDQMIVVTIGTKKLKPELVTTVNNEVQNSFEQDSIGNKVSTFNLFENKNRQVEFVNPKGCFFREGSEYYNQFYVDACCVTLNDELWQKLISEENLL